MYQQWFELQLDGEYGVKVQNFNFWEQLHK